MVRVTVGFMGMSVLLLAGYAAAADEGGGVTGDVGVGLGATQTSTSYGVFNGGNWAHFSYDDAEFAVLLPTLSLGTQLTKTLAIGARVSNFWYVPEDGEVVGGYFGVDGRYLGKSGLLLAGGVGLMLTGETFEGDADVGFGSDLRAGYLPFSDANSAFGFFAELVPGFVDEDFTYSVGGGLMCVAR